MLRRSPDSARVRRLPPPARVEIGFAPASATPYPGVSWPIGPPVQKNRSCSCAYGKRRLRSVHRGSPCSGTTAHHRGAVLYSGNINGWVSEFSLDKLRQGLFCCLGSTTRSCKTFFLCYASGTIRSGSLCGCLHRPIHKGWAAPRCRDSLVNPQPLSWEAY